MRLHQSQINPSNPHQLERKKTSQLTSVYHRLLSFWHWSQIGHRSEYSVERMLALQDYYENTPITHVLAVCFLTPIPGVLLTVLVDCIPLADPSQGWEANYAFWVRGFLDMFGVSIASVAQVRAIIEPDTISIVAVVLISLGAASICIMMLIGVAATWCFPVPFGLVLFVVPYIAIMSLFVVLGIGPRKIAKSPVLAKQLKAHAWIAFAQGIVAMAYPLFTAVFYRLSGIEQTAFVFVMPLIKFAAKTMVAKAARGLYCYVAMLVVFSVDVFNVLYIVICMQFANSTMTTVVMISLDCFHVIIGVRAIFHQISVARKRRFSSKSYLEQSSDCLGELSVMMNKLLRDLHASNALRCRIRVFAPFPLALSGSRAAILHEIAKASQQIHIHPLPKLRSQTKLALKMISNAPYHKSESITIIKKPNSSEGKIKNSAFDIHKQNRVVPVGPVVSTIILSSNERVRRKMSTPRRLLRLMDSNVVLSASKVREALSYEATETAVRDILQAFFHAEYLLIAEYIECALPMLYALYLLVLSQLPTAQYYPQTALPFHKLVGSVTNILIFTMIEFVGFVGLLVFLRTKLGVSALYQLAFVLETHAQTVQGHLLVWTVFILRMTLKHNGTRYCIDSLVCIY
ncbi:unnamed protein product [Phytophthora fragariaefolia]|uniref:Unnamed protein product n=1 Tax=Phytophthora fragariaefolia TaxID=1490495 RepID=A0A9W6TVR2_9STRA|nr:unnamed protein product [Phytophthora fragariaefolia]